jgi:hypothetical protein
MVAQRAVAVASTVVADSTAVATVADIGNLQPQRQSSNNTKHGTTPILPKADPGKDGRFCVSYLEYPLRLRSYGSSLLAAFTGSHCAGVLRLTERLIRHRTSRSLTWFRWENLLDRITVANDDFQLGQDRAIA